MNLEWSDSAREFRARLRAWLDENLPPDWRTQITGPEDLMSFQRRWDRLLFEGGWAGMFWPTEYGGTDATPEEKAIFAEELARADAPDGLATLGMQLLAPALIRYGTEDQREKLLPRILSGEDIWCQGFSEPNAGSDLASVSTFGELHDQSYVVNGSKLWTSRAHYANKCFLLARTSRESNKHQGLTMLLLDMNQPGVSVVPLKQLNGHSNFNQVFFNDALVSRGDTLGPPGSGWEVARFILTHERGAGTALGAATRMEHALREFHSRAPSAASARSALARASTETVIARLLGYSILSHQIRGEDPGHAGSSVKLFWSEAQQRLSEAALRECGSEGLSEYEYRANAGDPGSMFLDARRSTIAGGTSEIQREIIARETLHLPRYKARKES